MSSFDKIDELLNEYSGTPAEVRAYRKKTGAHVKQWKRWYDKPGNHEKHAAHERARVERNKEGGKKHKCKKCGETEGRMEEHHSDGWKKGDPTEYLCTKCHQKTKVKDIKKGMKEDKIYQRMSTFIDEALEQTGMSGSALFRSDRPQIECSGKCGGMVDAFDQVDAEGRETENPLCRTCKSIALGGYHDKTSSGGIEDVLPKTNLDAAAEDNNPPRFRM